MSLRKRLKERETEELKSALESAKRELENVHGWRSGKTPEELRMSEREELSAAERDRQSSGAVRFHRDNAADIDLMEELGHISYLHDRLSDPESLNDWELISTDDVDSINFMAKAALMISLLALAFSFIAVVVVFT